MNVPNFLTVFRIFCIPVLVVILLSEFEGREITAFIIFAVAALTDMVDGIWARKKKQVTTFGELLDPIADKLLISSVLICLVGLGIVPSWMAVIIIGRELMVTGFRAIASSKGINIPSFPLGKIKMWSEAVTICILILGEGILGKLFILSQIGLWIIIILAIASAAEYYIKFGSAILTKNH